MTLAEYIRDPAPTPSLSPSVAHLLVTRSARHAWHAHPKLNPAWQPEATAESDLGSIAHALFLERDASRVVVVEADDWRTKVAKEARDTARAEGKLPILAAKYGAVEAMVVEVRRAVADSELADVFADGQAEQTMLWQESLAGELCSEEAREGMAPGEPPAHIWCRTRPDWQSADRRVLVDYKTTGGNAEPDAWARTQLLGMGYEMQAAFGVRAVSIVAHVHEPAFVFVVQETDSPYAVSFVSLTPAWLAWAEHKRRAAVAQWAHCLTRDSWPGYPSQIAYAEPPGWAMAGWEAQQQQPVDDGRPLSEQLFGGRP